MIKAPLRRGRKGLPKNRSGAEDFLGKRSNSGAGELFGISRKRAKRSLLRRLARAQLKKGIDAVEQKVNNGTLTKQNFESDPDVQAVARLAKMGLENAAQSGKLNDIIAESGGESVTKYSAMDADGNKTSAQTANVDANLRGFDAFEAGERARNKAADMEQYEQYKAVLGSENVPETFDLFQDLKYNDTDGWNKLMRNHKLFTKIDNTDSYSAEYKAKLKETYRFFGDNGHEFTEHGLGRMLGQRVSKSKRAFTKEDVLSILEKPVNYIQEDGKVVKYYEQIAVIQATDTGEVISIVTMKEAKTIWRKV